RADVATRTHHQESLGTAGEGTLSGAPLDPTIARPLPRPVSRGQARRRQLLSWPIAALALDATALAAALALSEFTGPRAGLTAAPLVWVPLFAIMTLGLLALRHAYRQPLGLQILDQIRGVAIAVGLAAVIVIAIRVAVEDNPTIASETLRQAALAGALLAVSRTAFLWSQAHARREGRAARRTLVVGAGHVGAHTARRLLDRPEFGLRPVGYLDKDPREGEELEGLPVLGASWDLERVVTEHEIAHVIFAFSTAPHSVLLSLVQRCEELELPVSLVPRLFEKVTGRISVEHLGGLPLLEVRRADPRGWQFAIKYALDRIAALVMIVLTAPVLAIAAIAVLISLGRPVLYRQIRTGRDGRPFEILKFRSMRPPVGDQKTGSVVTAGLGPGGVEGDDRRSAVGAVLRKTSLDELPQLFNVLKGEMSLIGPRPERPEFVELFREEVHRYGERHRVKAGITGWAQVHGLRGKTSMSDRVEWDNYYIENWSLWLDFKILIRTVSAVVRPGSSVE
ncbi:MAG: sugar transferase, partial [Gaiellaceae bacterium]